MKEKRLLNYSSGDNTDFSINFIPKMNRQELLSGYRKVVRTIYSPEHYYRRIVTFLKTFLKTYTPMQQHRHRISPSDIKALFKSVWLMGVWSSGRRYYWKLLLRSLRHRRQFHLIMMFAINGFHFRKVFAV